MDKPLLDLYADYLIAAFGPATTTGFSRLLSSGLSHDKVTRLLSERTFTSADLWHLVKPLVRKGQDDSAVLVIDDSIGHKPHADASELIGWHYDHATDTSVGCSCSVKGINFLTTLYCTGEVSLPVAFALVERGTRRSPTPRRASPSGAPASARTSAAARCSEPASRTRCRSVTSSTTCGSRRPTT